MNSTENDDAHHNEPRKEGDAQLSRIEEGLLQESSLMSEDVAVFKDTKGNDAVKKIQGTAGKVLQSGNLDPLNGTRTVETTVDDDDLKNFRSCRDGFDLNDEESKPRDKLLFKSAKKTTMYPGNVTESDDDIEEHDEIALLRGQVGDLREQMALLQKSSDSNKKDIEKIDGQPLLPEDSYSFLAITRPDTSCKNPGVSFIWAIFIFCFQILTLTLLAVDVIDRENEDNKLGIPGGVDKQVRIAQLIAIIITVISQDEVRQSFNVIYDGYDRSTVEKAFFNEDRNQSSVEGSSDRVMRTRWYAASVFRLVEGCFALAVTFMLVVRATTVRDLLLNFTAVEFVSSVDDAVFLLSKWGYFGDIMSDDAESVANARLDESKGKRGREFPRTAFLVAIFLGMLGPWLYLSYEQEKGEYLEPIIYVQFGDEFSPALGTFSGVYRAEIPRPLRLFSGRRVDYVGHDGSARFSYCQSRRYWAFLYGDDYNDTSLNECGNKNMIRAISSESYAFDITETASDRWFVKDDENYRDVPLQHFSLSTRERVVTQECSNSTKDEDDEGGRFVCTSDALWACNPNWFGVNCQFEAPCDLLEINERYAPFADARGWSSGYKLVLNTKNTPVQVYGRPAYIGNETHSNKVRDLMFFTGRRWVLTNTNLIQDLKKKTDLNETIISNYISRNFHAHWSKFEVVFISEAVDIDTPADGPTPVGLSWFRSKAPDEQKSDEQTSPIQAPDFNQDQDTVLLCATCNVTSNPCLLGGTCSKANNTRCDCITGSKGTLCQIAPTGDGRCNHHFNTAGYGWDGGDCCPRTCKNVKFKCGTNESSRFGFLFDEYIGFPHCLNPSQLCDDNTQCWKPLAELRGTIEGSEAGQFVAISGNGVVVAVSAIEQGSLVVRVFEQDGNDWKSRGEPLKASSSLSRRLQDDAEDGTTDSNALVDVASLITLSEDGSVVVFVANGMIYTYHWVTLDETWNRPSSKTVDEAIGYSGSGVKSLALSSDGIVLVVDRVSGEDGCAFHEVELYRYIPVEEWVLVHSGLQFGSQRAFGMSLSLSSSGHILAIGHTSPWTYSSNSDESWNAYVTVYAFENDWSYAELFGPPLRGDGNIVDELASYSVSLSSDGQILAVGSPNEAIVRVFSYNSTSKSWTQVGDEISSSEDGKNDQSSSFGASVSLSGNGTILAVGVPYPDGINDHVEVYAWSKESWNLYGKRQRVANDDGSGTSVALSDDGSVLVFGAPQFDREKFGMAKVMWNTETNAHNSSRTFAETDVPITVEIQLDASPWEIGMSLTCNGVLYGSIPQGTLTSQARVVGNQTIRVPKYSFCTFEITDFEGDGIRTGKKGFYKIYYGTEKNETTLLARGGELFGSIEQITFKVEPSSLVPIIANMELSTSSLASAKVEVICDANNIPGDVLRVRAPPGAFQKSTLDRSATFLLPKGSICRFSLTGSNEGKRNRGSVEFFGTDSTNSLQKGIMNDDESSFVVPGCKGCECADQSLESSLLVCSENETQMEFVVQTNENGARVSFGLFADGNFGSSVDRPYFSVPCSSFSDHKCVPDNECNHYLVANTPMFNGGGVNYTIRVGKDIVANGTNFLGYSQVSIGDCPAPPTASPIISDCDNDEALVLIELTIDRFPQDISWSLFDNTKPDLLLESEDYKSEMFFAATISKAICVPKDSCLTFTIQDLAGNGLCCDAGNGSVIVSYDSVVVANASDFESQYMENFGNCDNVPSTTMSPTSSPTVFRPAECDEGSTSLFFEINMDGKPHEIDWVLVHEIDAEEGFGYDRFNDAFETFSYQICVADNACILFFIQDRGGDGLCCDYGKGSYSLYFGDEKISSSDDLTDLYEMHFQCETIAPTPPSPGPWDPNASPHYATPPPISPPPTPGLVDCGPDGMELRIQIIFDSYPAETSWKVMVDGQDGFVILEGGPYEQGETFSDVAECVPDDESLELTFIITDTYGDGICCSSGDGHFKIYLGNGQLIHLGRGDFGSQQVIVFSEQNGAMSQMPVGTPVPSPQSSPQLSPQSPSACPPSPGDFCDQEGLSCSYEQCCPCGECAPAISCSCENGVLVCVSFDACSQLCQPPGTFPSSARVAPPEPDT